MDKVMIATGTKANRGKRIVRPTQQRGAFTATNRWLPPEGIQLRHTVVDRESQRCALSLVDTGSFVLEVVDQLRHAAAQCLLLRLDVGVAPKAALGIELLPLIADPQIAHQYCRQCRHAHQTE